MLTICLLNNYVFSLYLQCLKFPGYFKMAPTCVYWTTVCSVCIYTVFKISRPFEDWSHLMFTEEVFVLFKFCLCSYYCCKCRQYIKDCQAENRPITLIIGLWNELLVLLVSKWNWLTVCLLFLSLLFLHFFVNVKKNLQS